MTAEIEIFDFFNFFSSQKIGKKSLIPTVYNNLGQPFLEMGQKRQNMPKSADMGKN